MIKYEAFERAINSLKKFNEDMELYEKILRTEGPWWNLYEEALKLLASSMCEGTSLDYDTMLDDIDYFTYECDSGKDWYDGMMTDENGDSIDWSTPKKFYDYQVKEAEVAK